MWFTSIACIVAGRVLPYISGEYKWHTNDVCLVEGPWAVCQVEWPTPLFTPSAAAFAPDGRTLWLASDWLLAPLSDLVGDGAHGVNSSSIKLGKVTRLPIAAKGLWIPPLDTRILVIGEDAIHPLDLPSTVSEGAVGVFASALDPAVVRSSMATIAGAPLALPSAELGGPMVAAAAAGLPKIVENSDEESGAGAMVVAMTPEARGLFISAAVQLGQRSQVGANIGDSAMGQVEVAIKVPEQPSGSQVRALHICVEPALCGASEPVLWAADASGCLTATGLGSGQVLVAWRWATQQLSVISVALAGNASHLFLVTPCSTGQTAVLLSAPYTALLGHRASAAAECHDRS